MKPAVRQLTEWNHAAPSRSPVPESPPKVKGLFHSQTAVNAIPTRMRETVETMTMRV